jgi:hypothetical protein
MISGTDDVLSKWKVAWRKKKIESMTLKKKTSTSKTDTLKIGQGREQSTKK